MKIERTNQTSFGAIHISNIRTISKNIQPDLQVYKLSKDDKKFIKSLSESIKVKDLMPDIPFYKLDVWQELFNIASWQVLDSRKTGVMITSNKKPCGLMAFTPSHLDIICTWPIETGKKVPFAGTALMKTLFEEFIKRENFFLTLNAVTNGPFSNVSKFTRLGFKQTGGENHITSMRTNRNKILEVLQDLNKSLKTIPVESNRNIDLFTL